MTLDFTTLGIFMTLFSMLLAVYMVVVWRINRHEAGLAFWAAAALVGIVVFGMIALRPIIGSAAIVINNIGSILGPLLLLEGILRYRQIGQFRKRLPWALAALVLVSVSAIINRENAPARFLLQDPVIMLVLALSAWYLVRDTRGIERTVHALTGAFFIALLLVLGFRWIASLGGLFEPGEHDNVISAALFLAAMLWAVGWAFGLTISTNLRASLRLARVANQDVLTGLPNRRYLQLQLKRLMAPKGSQPSPGLAVIMMDINSFKDLNDRVGHQFGDDVLQGFASLLSRQIRPEDLAIRYGGDEFVVVLRGMSCAEQLRQATARLRGALEQGIQIGGRLVDVRVSMGAALFPEDADNAQELLDLADRRMYEDKRAGLRASLVRSVLERREDPQTPGQPA